jgi:hypothetical protein
MKMLISAITALSLTASSFAQTNTSTARTKGTIEKLKEKLSINYFADITTPSINSENVNGLNVFHSFSFNTKVGNGYVFRINPRFITHATDGENGDRNQYQALDPQFGLSKVTYSSADGKSSLFTLLRGSLAMIDRYNADNDTTRLGALRLYNSYGITLSSRDTIAFGLEIRKKMFTDNNRNPLWDTYEEIIYTRTITDKISFRAALEHAIEQRSGTTDIFATNNESERYGELQLGAQIKVSKDFTASPFLGFDIHDPDLGSKTSIGAYISGTLF